MKKPLSRRTVLRGAFGVGVALPFLDAMTPVFGRGSLAYAATTPPNRFVVMYGGISYGTGSYKEPEGMPEQQTVPSTTGAGYATTRALKPLETEKVKDKVTVFSNLTLPWEENGSMPPGGRSIPFHGNTVGPQFSGVAGPSMEANGVPRGATCDQLVAAVIGKGTTFPVLAYRVQPAGYVGTNSLGGNSGALSWRKDSSGKLQRVDPTVSPRVAYENLFTGFTSSDPIEAARARIALKERASVLDLVHEDLNRVVAQVGPADRHRLEEHFEQIRALEARVKSTPPATGACAATKNPGADPPIGGTIIEYKGEGMPYSTTNGYSNEDLRADVMTDLITMAFACDRSRVASLLITQWKCYMNMYQLYGWKTDMHSCTHGGSGRARGTADGFAFHIKQFARLVRKLDATLDADGKTLLSRTAMALTFEGGRGYDPSGGGSNSGHSTEGMVVLLAGGAGGMTHGSHIDGKQKHPASVFVTAMRAVGAGDRLGDIKTSAL